MISKTVKLGLLVGSKDVYAVQKLDPDHRTILISLPNEKQTSKETKYTRWGRRLFFFCRK